MPSPCNRSLAAYGTVCLSGFEQPARDRVIPRLSGQDYALPFPPKRRLAMTGSTSRPNQSDIL